MKILSLAQSAFKLTGISIIILTMNLAFQNCSNGLSSSSSVSNTAADHEEPDESGMRVIGDGSTAGATNLKIVLYATDLLNVDCSLPGSSYKLEILNAPPDITMCQEYMLDMPQGNSRYAETYRCDSSEKFVKPPSTWHYDVAQRKWSKVQQTSGSQYIPGSYRLYVRDSSGEALSALLNIRRVGYANCINTASSSSPTPLAPGTTCNPPGTKLFRLNTQLPERSFPRTDYHPEPNQIYSFAFKTPNTNAMVTMRLSSAQLGTTPSHINPVIVVSECPGDVSSNMQNKLGVGCSMASAEASHTAIAVNISPDQVKANGASPNAYCYLKPNTQYYANVFSKDRSPNLPTTNCATPHCGFSFTGN